MAADRDWDGAEYFSGVAMMTPSSVKSQRRSQISRMAGFCFLSAARNACHGMGVNSIVMFLKR
jgi:hypothetical protein